MKMQRQPSWKKDWGEGVSSDPRFPVRWSMDLINKCLCNVFPSTRKRWRGATRDVFCTAYVYSHRETVMYPCILTLRDKMDIRLDSVRKGEPEQMRDRLTEQRVTETGRASKQQKEDTGFLSKSVSSSFLTLALCLPDILKIPRINSQLFKRNMCAQF